MKKFLLPVLSSVLVLALTGCTKDLKGEETLPSEIAVMPSSEKAVVLNTKGYVEGATFTETYRSGLHPTGAAQHPRHMQMSSYLYPQDGVEGNYFVGKSFAQSTEDEKIWWNVKKDGASETHDPIYWPVGGKLDFLAYSLTEETSGAGAGKNVSVAWGEKNAASEVTLNVPAENTQNDILFASAANVKAAASGSTVALTFNHAQAWLEFALSCEGTAELDRIELEDIYAGGNLEISNNSGNALAKWNFSGIQSGDMPVDNYNDVRALTSDPQYLDMLIPQQAKSAFTIYYTLGADPKVRSYRFDTDRKTWLMGEKYVYNIHISSNSVDIVPTVVLWDTVEDLFSFTLRVSTNDAVRGTVKIDDEAVTSKKYNSWGAQATLSAVAKEGFKFEKWEDGNTDNPRIVSVTKDVLYKAQFKENTTP